MSQELLLRVEEPWEVSSSASPNQLLELTLSYTSPSRTYPIFFFSIIATSYCSFGFSYSRDWLYEKSVSHCPEQMLKPFCFKSFIIYSSGQMVPQS